MVIQGISGIGYNCPPQHRSAIMFEVAPPNFTALSITCKVAGMFHTSRWLVFSFSLLLWNLVRCVNLDNGKRSYFVVDHTLRVPVISFVWLQFVKRTNVILRLGIACHSGLFTESEPLEFPGNRQFGGHPHIWKPGKPRDMQLCPLKTLLTWLQL